MDQVLSELSYGTRLVKKDIEAWFNNNIEGRMEPLWFTMLTKKALLKVVVTIGLKIIEKWQMKTL